MSFVLVHDRSRLGHKPDCRLGWSSEYVRKSMYACHSVSVACRPAERRRRRGEIGSIRRSILVGHRRPNRSQSDIKNALYNPLRPTAIQKLLEMIGRVRLCSSYSFAIALDLNINQTAARVVIWVCEKIDVCMPQCVCCVAGQPRRAGAAAKSGQFVGQFSWVTGDPTGLKGLRNPKYATASFNLYPVFHTTTSYVLIAKPSNIIFFVW